MKKLVIAILLLILLPSALAIEFNVLESYSSGETVITKLSGNFLTPVSKENIFFYQEHVRIPFEYEIAKIGQDYYIYFLLSGKSSGNYSIALENIKYMSGSIVSEEDVKKNFSITNVTADFSIDPGFIVTSKPFSIEIQNLLDEEISVTATTEDASAGERELFISLAGNFKEADFSLNSGEVKKIDFSIAEGSISIQEITIKTGSLTYTIPVSLSTSEEQQTGLSESFKFLPSDMVFALPTESTTKRIIYFLNTGNTNVEDISLELSESLVPFVKLSTSKIENLGAGENSSIELLIQSDDIAEVQGTLKAKTNATLDSFFISLKFSENVTLIQNGASEVLNCEELDGFICNYEEQSCSGEVVSARDNVCCLGSCRPIRQAQGGRVIAIILIIIVMGGLVWFYFKKYKKARRPVDLLKVAKGKNPSNPDDNLGNSGHSSLLKP